MIQPVYISATACPQQCYSLPNFIHIHRADEDVGGHDKCAIISATACLHRCYSQPTFIHIHRADEDVGGHDKRAVR